MTGPGPLWDAHLDALEEWVRECGRALATAGPGAAELEPPPPPTGEPDVPLPRSHALRARVLVAAMDEVVAAGAVRRAADDRAARYQRG